jgi:glycine dehydrogenase
MNTDSFAQRHIGPRKSDLSKMLKTIGVNSMQQLIEETIPEDILLDKKLSLSKAMSEQEYQGHNNLLSKKKQTI